MEKIMLAEKWEPAGDRVRLHYEDGSVLHVKRSDFDRAFGAIMNAPKENVLRDFAIESAPQKKNRSDQERRFDKS